MILLISAVFPPEPVVSASLTFDLAIALSEITEVKVLSPRPSRPLGFSFKNENEVKRKFEHIILNSFTYPKSKIAGRMFESYCFGKHAVDYIRKNRSEIKCIYINTWPLFSQYLIIKTTKKYLIPTVIHIQDIYPESFVNKIHFFSKIIMKILLPMDKYILKNSSQIIAISENLASILAKTRKVHANKFEIIYNWQNEIDFSGKKDLGNLPSVNESSKKLFTFMYLGNIGPVAGVDLLIKSFSKAKIPGSSLIIAGSGSRKDHCIKLAESFNKTEISFWDVPAGKVPETQQKADILLLPLRNGAALSSIPSKLVAYMFSAKPVIACVDEGSDTANTIMKANCGWIVPPENTEILSDTMKNVAYLPKKDLQRLGKNGFNYAIENFSRKKNLEKLVKIIIDTASR